MNGLKVGDIVYYDKEVYRHFRWFLYDRHHVITKIEGRTIYTKGYGWNYIDFPSGSFNELQTSDPDLLSAIKPIHPNVWNGSKLVFNFIR